MKTGSVGDYEGSMEFDISHGFEAVDDLFRHGGQLILAESSNFNGNFRYIFQICVLLLLNDFERSESWLFKTSLFATIN